MEKGYDRGKKDFLSLVIFKILSAGRERFGWRLEQQRYEEWKKIYVGQSEREIFFDYYGRLGKKIVAVILVGILLFFGKGFFSQQGNLVQQYYLAREEVTGGDREISLQADNGKNQKEVTVTVPARKYAAEELDQVFSEVHRKAQKLYLGDNPSCEEISKPLYFVQQLDGINLRWEPSSDGIIDSDGAIHNEELSESVQTELTLILSYGEREERHAEMVTVLPEEKSEEERFWEYWESVLFQNQKNTETQEYMKLPEEIEGSKMHYGEKQVSELWILFMGVMLFGLILLQERSRMQEEIKKRQEQLRMDYPEFVEHFVLLIGAGLTVKGTWEHIVRDYQKREKRGKYHYVYEEMAVAVREMENGMSEARAYELFGKRTGLLPYMKFCTLLMQNLKKGSSDLIRLLDYEMTDAFRQRKENAREQGEKAGTKLLLPMAVMMGIVFALILYAAFQSM